MSIHRQGPTEMQQPIKSDRQTLSAFDDDAIMQQIQATHIFDGHEVDVKPILHIIEDIFLRYSPGINGDIHGTMQKDSDVTLEENAMIVGFDGIQEALASIIRKISCELSYKCSSGADAHETTMSIFNLLSNYSWDAKVVISLAAFSVNYGEFWLVAHSGNTNHLIKSISLLKQVPNIIEHGGSLKSPFDALSKLINVMLEVTRSIVEFKGLPKQYISPNAPPTWTAMAHFPIAAYWVIRSMVAGASQIVSFFHMSNEDITSTTEASELISLAQKVDDIHSHLKRQERICHQLLNLKRDTDDIDIYHRYISKTDKFSILIRRRIQLLFDTVLVRLFEIAHTDNQRILKALIYAKDDILPLVEGTTKTRVGIEVLSRKTVLLLISDLDILHEEIVILGQYYQEMKLNNDLHFDIVWLPIIDKTTPWTKSHQLEFEKLLSMMPWYSVHHPSLLEPEVVRYIKEVWLFTKNPILVVLNPQAEVVCTNALHMMRIWGNKAYPFTSLREESLWKEEAWRLELIVDKIDAEILEWIIQGKYICLYGGDDIEWIRKFTTTAKQVTRSAGITLEMVYVGKSNAKECVRRINRAIMKENLSHCWPHPTSIWYFWARLESMLSTKIKHGKSIQNDRIMQEILTVLSFDGSESSDQGWAIIGRGSDEITKAKGYPLLTSLTKFESWEDEAREKGFVAALEDNLLQLHTLQHCNHSMHICT